jgi:hypothetical protein
MVVAELGVANRAEMLRFALDDQAFGWDCDLRLVHEEF